MNWQFWLRNRPTADDNHADACVDIRPLLSLMSDSLASPQEKRRADAHLAACADCRQAHSWMEATHRAIAERPATLPPVDLRARIARAIAASAETSVPVVPVATHIPRRAFVLRPAYAAAMSVAIAGVFLGHSLLSEHASPQAPLVSPARPSVAARPLQRSAPHVAALAHQLRLPKPPHQSIVALLPRTIELAPQFSPAPTKREMPLLAHPRTPAVTMARLPHNSPLPPHAMRSPVVHSVLILARRSPQAHSVSPPRAANSPALLAANTLPVRPPQSPAVAIPVPHAPEPLETHPATVQVARLETPLPTNPRPVHGDALSGVRSSLQFSRRDDFGRHLGMASTGIVHTASYVQMPMTHMTDSPGKAQ